MDDDVTRAMPAAGGWESGSDGSWLLGAAKDEATTPEPTAEEPTAPVAPARAAEGSTAPVVAPPVAQGPAAAAGEVVAVPAVLESGLPSPDATVAWAAPAAQAEPADAPGAGAAGLPGVRNEAIPEEPPEEGHGQLGVVPAASAQRRWARQQAANWRLFLVRFLCAGLAVIAAVVVVPGLGFTSWRWGQFTTIAIVFGLLNATVKPALQFLVLRFILSTYGIVVVVINTLLLALLGRIMRDAIATTGLLPLLVGGLAVGTFGLLFETLLGANPPVLDRDYKERNGLK